MSAPLTERIAADPLAPLRELADEWDESTASGHPACAHDDDCVSCAADELRAAIAAVEALLPKATQVEWASAAEDDMKPGPVLDEQTARTQVHGWNLSRSTQSHAILLRRVVGPWEPS